MGVNIPPWHKEERLVEMYVNRGLTMEEVADEWGCSVSTVSDWLAEYGVGSRGAPGVHWYEGADGYCELRVGNGDESVRIGEHVLAALVENPAGEVFSSDTVAHHRDKWRFDNRPENVQVLDSSDHLRLHSCEVWGVDGGFPVLIPASV